jgi:hypothetical protein
MLSQPVEMLVPERSRHQHPGYRDGFFKHRKPNESASPANSTTT